MNRKTLVIRVFAAAMLVVVFVPPGRASICFDDGGYHRISGGVFDGGIEASHGSIVDISGGVIDGSISVSDDAKVYFYGGQINGGIDAFAGGTFIFGPASSSLFVPEPSALIVWSLLGTFAIGIGWWRKRKAV